MGNSAKQRCKLSSGNILSNSMASPLPFTPCTPSVPSPCKVLKIKLGIHSKNPQHILVPDASYSRTLKAITQIPEDPEGELCTPKSPNMMLLHRTAKSHQDPSAVTLTLVVSLPVHQEESGVDNFVSGQCSFVSCFPQSSEEAKPV